MLTSLRLKSRSSSLRRPSSFRSYIDLTNSDPPNEPEEEDGGCYIQLTPSLLSGEVVVAHADNVLRFDPFSELKTGISGALFCTNFKISFVTAHRNPYSLQHQNLLLGENDICLMNIDSLHQVCSGRRKKLTPGSSVASSLEIIEVHCKDFRILTFSFKFSLPGQDKALTNALLHHAFAPKVQLLFAFEYGGQIESGVSSSRQQHRSVGPFSKSTDWMAELRRTRCSKRWRVTQANEKFLLCDSFPETFVVPAKLLDAELALHVPSFSNHRAMAWSWGVERGPALVRMGSVDPSIADDRHRSSLMEAVAGASPTGSQPQVIDLNVDCPSVREIQTSFLKLKELCMPASSLEFWEQDSHYYSSLESTRWLHCVSSLLRVALQGAEVIEHQQSSLVLEEGDNRDLNCAASSLVQIMLDPWFRTQRGFELLIEKEWIAMGHDFPHRLAHLRDVEAHESPIFLLFLDCVWQLQNQFPCAFEFSETYLTTLWDSTHNSVLGSFLFSSHRQRLDFNRHFLDAFDWKLQFSAQDSLLFRNPLFVLDKSRSEQPTDGYARPHSLGPDSLLQSTSFCSPPDVRDNLLTLDPSPVALELWSQCYLRFLPLANVVGGGTPVVFLQNLLAAEEVKFLLATLKILDSKTKKTKQKANRNHKRSASDDFCMTVESDARSIPGNTSLVTSAFPFSAVGPSEWRKFNVPSSSCLCVSYLGPEDQFDHSDD